VDTRLRVFVQSAKRGNLTEQQQRFLDGLLDQLKRADLSVMQESPSTATIDERLEKARGSHGIIILAFAQWEGRRVTRGNEKKSAIFPSEFAHMSGVMAVVSGRPLLVLREKSVAERGALRPGYLHPTVTLPNSLDTKWFGSDEFAREFAGWLKGVRRCRHVFLGYSSQAAPVANLVSQFLTEKLSVRVFDWHDFQPGEAIWESIERAERQTDAGIFLFMSDDSFVTGRARRLAPRDNVIYEAGYFAGAKGRSNTIIIREKGAKIPTDLDGILYLEINDRQNIAAIESRLREHIGMMLDHDGAARV
jgi:CAP12/Pycsar effector protein, TIR domain